MVGSQIDIAVILNLLGSPYVHVYNVYVNKKYWRILFGSCEGRSPNYQVEFPSKISGYRLFKTFFSHSETVPPLY